MPGIIRRPIAIYHITHVDNLPGIIDRGGLGCTNLLTSRGIPYRSIAHRRIQDRRAVRHVPCGPGGTIHDYVPFYFAPRSPMLCSIYYGNVEGYTGTQGEILHLVSTVEAVCSSDSGWVFTDGHSTMELSDFYDDLRDLDRVDWDIMGERFWADTPEDGDRSRRRQAEFMVYRRLSWEHVFQIGVIDDIMRKRVNGLLSAAGHNPIAAVRRGWYY